jgi:hypothetical protein
MIWRRQKALSLLAKKGIGWMGRTLMGSA